MVQYNLITPTLLPTLVMLAIKPQYAFTRNLVKELQNKQIFMTDNRSSFYHPAHFDNSLRVSLAKISTQQIHEVYPILYQPILSLFEKYTDAQ